MPAAGNPIARSPAGISGGISTLPEFSPMSQSAPPFRPDTYPEQTIGRLMEPPVAVFPGDLTAAEATERVRELATTRVFTYCYIVDEQNVLRGVVTMRD